MAIADPNITHVGVDCITGPFTRPDTDADATQREADALAHQAQLDAQAAEQTRIDGLKASIAVKMGQTPQQGLDAEELAYLKSKF